MNMAWFRRPKSHDHHHHHHRRRRHHNQQQQTSVGHHPNHNNKKNNNNRISSETALTCDSSGCDDDDDDDDNDNDVDDDDDDDDDDDPLNNKNNKNNNQVDGVLHPTARQCPTKAENNDHVVLDLEREKTRLESLESYVLVSILTASASFAVLDAAPDPFLAGGSGCSLVSTLTVFAAGLSSLCGLHATVVFSLCVLYGKTALGRYHDDAYQAFLQRVAPQRVRGFTTFAASLLLFAVETALLLYQHAPPKYQTVALVLAVVSTYLLITDGWAVMHAATIHIFPTNHHNCTNTNTNTNRKTTNTSNDTKK
ncbi:hypothetical protein ACA910_001323 [Epithemia clementina (nom. ined.)]